MDTVKSTDVSKLCQQYPFIKLKYITSIDHAQNIIDNVALGSQGSHHLFGIPLTLMRCKLDLETLQLDRARDYYDEVNNGPLLDSIEDRLKEVITKMEHLNRHHDCNIFNKLKNAVIKHIELDEANGKDCSDGKNRLFNLLSGNK